MNINFSGLWNANLQVSKLFGAPPKTLVVSIDHADPALSMEMVVTKPDDTENRIEFRGLTTGEEVENSVCGIPVRSSARWVGTELLIETKMDAGGRENVLRDYWCLSADGQTLTMEHRDDALAGQLAVLERKAD